MTIADGTLVEFKEFVGIFLTEEKFLVLESCAPAVACDYEILDVKIDKNGWYEIVTRGFITYMARPENAESSREEIFYDPERDDFDDEYYEQ